MITVSNLADTFGFSVQNYSQPGRTFWATLMGQNQVVYTVRADRMDVEDFAMTLEACAHYDSPGKFIKDLSPESWEHFIYLFLDHTMDREKHCGKVKLTIMGKIFDIIVEDASEPIAEFYTHSGFKVAGHTLNLFARRVEDNANYYNQFGGYRVWIESPSIICLDSLMKVHTDVLTNYIVRGCRN